MERFIESILTNPLFLIIWGMLVLVSLIVLALDLKNKNSEIVGLMKAVWVFTVAYSGPIGLAIYYYSGRKQIPRDSIGRRGFRSTAHCYSGCGAGEIVGVFVSAGLLGLGTWWVVGITFTLAYVAGFALTAGPLIQEGVGFTGALWDAFYSETASITVMEVVTIGVDIWLAGDATIGDPLFWSSLIFSLSMGLFAAFPVNVLLVRWGVKKGMHSPKEMAEHAR